MRPTDLEVELSQFTARLRWRDLPPAAQDRVLSIWVDALANALAGRLADRIAVVERLAGDLCGPGESTVIGGDTMAPSAAAFVNGYQITAFTMCDVYRPALCHITPEVVPAVLAVAEQDARSSEDLMTALAVGLEVTSRLGLGVHYPRLRARGWHAPGVIGTIGAAAAAARLAGLDERGVRKAVGLGVSQASGTFAALGTPAVKFHQARGAVSGLWAARFAAHGLGGAERGLTHPDGGLLAAYADGGQPKRALEQLGERWELEQVSLRRWPAASSLQSLVAALLELRADEPGELSGVDAVEVELPSTAYDMCADMEWPDQLSAMQSARFVTAVVLHEDTCWTDQFGADRRTDPEVDSFARTRVVVRRRPELPPSGVYVRIRRRSGPDLVRRHERAPGEPGDPLTREQIHAKLAAARAGTPTSVPADELAELLFATPDGPDAATVATALRSSPEPAPHGREGRP